MGRGSTYGPRRHTGHGSSPACISATFIAGSNKRRVNSARTIERIARGFVTASKRQTDIDLNVPLLVLGRPVTPGCCRPTVFFGAGGCCKNIATVPGNLWIERPSFSLRVRHGYAIAG